MENISKYKSKLSTCIPVLLNDLCINWLGANFAIHFKLKQLLRSM